jgi:hypothetical protein
VSLFLLQLGNNPAPPQRKKQQLKDKIFPFENITGALAFRRRQASQSEAFAGACRGNGKM